LKNCTNYNTKTNYNIILKGEILVMSEDLENVQNTEEIDNIIVLNDEEGNDVQFEFLDLIEYEDEEYVVLLPVEEDEEDSGEVVILKLEDTDSEEEESYVSVEDETILSKVFEMFKDKFKEMLDLDLVIKESEENPSKKSQ